ncbi:putative dehydrogenase [Pseudomonas aeruginosa]|nr:putative dehydrogenase [Pseudomonas aeruginosa]
MREHNDESFEFEVSVIGLGAMGTIMAQALLRQGRRVAIWNRSPGKAAALVAAGAHLCESAEAALAASPATIFVLLDNQATHEVLGMPGVMQALANRTIVDYTTNARDEGLALQSLVNRAGGHYVKGMIVAYPRNVGRRESHSIHTGDPEAFERHRALLEGLPAIRRSSPGTKHWPSPPCSTRMRLPRWWLSSRPWGLVSTSACRLRRPLGSCSTRRAFSSPMHSRKRSVGWKRRISQAIRRGSMCMPRPSPISPEPCTHKGPGRRSSTRCARPCNARQPWAMATRTS